MKKPVIGITCNYDYKDEVGMVSDMGTPGQDWNFVAGDYVYILEKAGAVPVIIPQYENPQNVKSILDCLDGVVITGGHDVDPVCYGEFPKEYCGRVMPKRDRQDIEIANYFLLEKRNLFWEFAGEFRSSTLPAAELCTRILSGKEALKVIPEAGIRAMRDGIESILNRGVALRISSEKAASWSIPIIIRESGCREKDAKSRESRKTESQRQSR